MRTATKFYGGKSLLAPQLVPLIPPHEHYCEPFCGSAALLFAKPPSHLETINDLDGDLVNFYRVLRDPEQCARLADLLRLTPYARAEFADCRRTYQEVDAGPVERARRWYVCVRQAFAGAIGHSGWSYTVTSPDGAAGTSKWLSSIERLPDVHARLSGVQVECRDWRAVLAAYDGPGVFLYCDPPYVISTRNHHRHGYAHEMTDQDHVDLVVALLAYRGRVLLSGYAHPLYEPLEHAGWQRIDIATISGAVGRTRAIGMQGAGTATRMAARTESLWMNYDPQQARGQGSLFSITDYAGGVGE